MGLKNYSSSRDFLQNSTIIPESHVNIEKVLVDFQ